MDGNKKRELYIVALERALAHQPFEVRNRIVQEVRDKIEEQLRQGRTVDQALQYAGSVESVCRKAGLEPEVRSEGWKRWLLILGGLFVGVLLVLMISVGSIIGWIVKSWDRGDWVFQVNEEAFEQEMDQFFLGGTLFPRSEEEALLEDSRDVQAYGVQKFVMKFRNGKVRYKWIQGTTIKWTCKVGGPQREGTSNSEANVLQLDLSQAFGARCEVLIPEGLPVAAEAMNGDVQVVDPSGDFDLKLSNGRVQIGEKRGMSYKYELSVNNGRVHAFKSSDSAESKKIRVEVGNGYIGTLDTDEE